jgi:hypothetical protein
MFPPPHYVLFEPLNDVETLKMWESYKKERGSVCEFTEVDAAEINSVDVFAPWFDNWISQIPEKMGIKYRVLLVLHSEFLTFSCQQMLRRYLEQRSFRCRVWFHVEDSTAIQPAIFSRSIVKRMPIYINEPLIK